MEALYFKAMKFRNLGFEGLLASVYSVFGAVVVQSV
jgi:hypothetical protein